MKLRCLMNEQDGSSGSGQPPPPGGQGPTRDTPDDTRDAPRERTFTADEVKKIVEDRLARERRQPSRHSGDDDPVAAFDDAERRFVKQAGGSSRQQHQRPVPPSSSGAGGDLNQALAALVQIQTAELMQRMKPSTPEPMQLDAETMLRESPTGLTREHMTELRSKFPEGDSGEEKFNEHIREHVNKHLRRMKLVADPARADTLKGRRR